MGDDFSMIEIPQTFDIPFNGGSITVAYKGRFDPAYDHRIVTTLDGSVLNVENTNRSYRLGFSNLPIIEPFPGFAVGLMRKIVENERSNAIKINLEEFDNGSTDFIDRAVYQILLNMQFPTVRGKFFDSLSCLPIAKIVGDLDEYSSAYSKGSITKAGFDCMRLVCLAESIDDIIGDEKIDRTVLNITSFDEISYSAPEKWLMKNLFETVSGAIMHELTERERMKMESSSFEKCQKEVYSRVRDHYAHASRARVEAQIFIPKG